MYFTLGCKILTWRQWTCEYEIMGIPQEIIYSCVRNRHKSTQWPQFRNPSSKQTIHSIISSRVMSCFLPCHLLHVNGEYKKKRYFNFKQTQNILLITSHNVQWMSFITQWIPVYILYVIITNYTQQIINCCS